MLSHLAPDLVIHILITNDLDGLTSGHARGVWVDVRLLLRRCSPASHGRACLVHPAFPTQYSSPGNTITTSCQEPDWESRHSRRGDGASGSGRMAPLVRQSGARYLAAVSYFIGYSAKLWYFLGTSCARERVFAVLPKRLHRTCSSLRSRRRTATGARRDTELCPQQLALQPDPGSRAPAPARPHALAGGQRDRRWPSSSRRGPTNRDASRRVTASRRGGPVEPGAGALHGPRVAPPLQAPGLDDKGRGLALRFLLPSRA